MSKTLLRELPGLVAAGVITEEVAGSIRKHYEEKASGTNRLILVFGILGSLLTGLGIILIIAHNWDDLAKPVKIFLALLPLLVGQSLCGFTLYRKLGDRLWQEGSGVFLFFAVAISIIIVSQVYYIHGSLERFLLIWMILSIPVIYFTRSAMVSLLVICGITWYGCEASYFHPNISINWTYWLMLASLIPFFLLLRKAGGRNFHAFHTWFLAISVIVMAGMFGKHEEEFLFITYMSLFSGLILLGGISGPPGKVLSNGFLTMGSLGATVLLLVFTFGDPWENVSGENLFAEKQFYSGIVMSVIAGLLLLYELRRKNFREIHAGGFLFIVFIPLFVLGSLQPQAAQLLTNLLVLAVAVITARRGADQDNLLVLNYGLLILTTLIICRYFDTDLSFVIRGILFMLVGFSFFGANYWMMKKRKSRQA